MTKHPKAKRVGALLFLAVLFGVLLYNALFTFSYSIGPNYRNVSVDTRVNITNAKPEVLTVTIENPITLSAGATRTVSCNATIRDYNGGNTVTNVSATFWDNSSVGVGAADDNNNHYTNATCQNTSISGYFANYTCNFTVHYYANNATSWVCNVTATDSYVFNSSVNGSSAWNYNTTAINQLLALNVTSLIDYGNLAVGDTSSAREANVTNFGNWGINVSVKGYGAAESDGLAFVCAVGNISIENERFSLNASGDYLTQYSSLSTAFQPVSGLTLPQQTNDTQQVINRTYWRLYVPPNPFGQCNGTVVFQAEAAN